MKNMALPILSLLILMFNGFITSCQDSAKPEQAAAEQTEEIEDPNAKAWGDWEPPQPGPYDELGFPSTQRFRPCVEIPEEVEQKLGIVLHRDREENGVLDYSCFFDLVEPSGVKETYYIATGEQSLQRMIDRGTISVYYHLPLFPEAVSTRSNIALTERSCEARVETPRGIVEVGYAIWEDKTTEGKLCAVADQILTHLYLGENYQQ